MLLRLGGGFPTYLVPRHLGRSAGSPLGLALLDGVQVSEQLECASDDLVLPLLGRQLVVDAWGDTHHLIQQLLHLARRVEVDLRLTGEELTHQGVQRVDRPLLSGHRNCLGQIVVGELLAQVGGHGWQLLLAGGELLSQHDLAHLFHRSRIDLREHGFGGACPALGEQVVPQDFPVCLVGGLVLALQLHQALEVQGDALHVGQRGQVLRDDLHVQIHIPGVLQQHDGAVVHVQPCGAQRVIAAVAQHPATCQLAHLVLLAIPTFLDDGGRDFTLQLVRHRLAGVVIHALFVKALHHRLLNGLGEWPGQHNAAGGERVEWAFQRGHMLVGLLVVVQDGLGALLQAARRVLVHVGRLDHGVQAVGEEPVPAVVLPLVAPGAIQNLELEGTVLHHQWAPPRLFHHLAALVHSDVVGVGVIHAHVDRVLQVVAEGERHACELVAKRVNAVARALAAHGLQPLVGLFRRGGLDVERDDLRLRQRLAHPLAGLLVVACGHQSLGAVPVTHAGDALLRGHLVPQLGHASLPLDGVGLGVHLVWVQAGHVPAGGHRRFRVDDLLQARELLHIFAQVFDAPVRHQALQQLQTLDVEYTHQVHESCVTEASRAGDVVGGVPHQRLVQRDVLVREGAEWVHVLDATLVDVCVLVDQHSQVPVNGNDDVGAVAQVLHQVCQHVVGLARLDLAGGEADIAQHGGQHLAGLGELLVHRRCLVAPLLVLGEDHLTEHLRAETVPYADAVLGGGVQGLHRGVQLIKKALYTVERCVDVFGLATFVGDGQPVWVFAP